MTGRYLDAELIAGLTSGASKTLTPVHKEALAL